MWKGLTIYLDFILILALFEIAVEDTNDALQEFIVKYLEGPGGPRYS